MKKIICFFMLICALFALSSCNIFDSGDEVESHTCTFDEIGYDDKNHFQKCTFKGCTEKIFIRQHNLTDTTIVVEQTHSTKGEKEIRCADCDYKLSWEIPEGHAFIYHQSKFPTCTSEGNGGYYECKECGELYRHASETGAFDPLTPEDIILPRYDHYYDNPAVAYTPSTLTENGKIELKCSVCKNIASEDYVLTLPKIPNNDTYKFVREDKPLGCTSDGETVYQLEKSVVIAWLKGLYENYQSVLELITEAGAFEGHTITYKATGHEIEPSIYYCSYKSEGMIVLGCDNCSYYIPTKADSEQFRCFLDKYDPENTELFEFVSDTSTCGEYGKITYNLKKDKITSILTQTFDLSSIQLEEYVNYICSRSYSFAHIKTDHNYNTILTKPTATTEGNFVIQCSDCLAYLSHSTDDYIYKASIPIPSEESEYYTLASQSFHCDADGQSTYTFNKSEYIRDYVSGEWRLDLTEQEIDEYCAFLDEALVLVEKPIGHLYNSDSPEITIPTYDTDGYIKFKCLRGDCGDYLLNSEQSDKLILPKVSSNKVEYSVNSETKKCLDFGSASLTISSDWLYDALRAYSPNVSSFGHNTKILNALTDFTVQTPRLNSHYGGIYDLAPHFKILETDNTKATIYCQQCKETLLVVDVLPFGSQELKSKFIEGDCSEADQTYYYMSYEQWLEIINGKEILLNNAVTTYDDLASAFALKMIYCEYGEIRKDIHRNYEFDPLTMSYTLPKYSRVTSSTVSGTYQKRCQDCKRMFDDTFEYTDGEWYQRSGQYQRRYYLHGDYVYDDIRTSWAISIGLDEGVEIDTTSFSAYNEYAYDAVVNNSFRINYNDFLVNGEYKSLKSIRIYLDGELVSEQELIDQGRLEKGTTLVWWRFYASTNKNGETIVGDIYISLNFEE